MSWREKHLKSLKTTGQFEGSVKSNNLKPCFFTCFYFWFFHGNCEAGNIPCVSQTITNPENFKKIRRLAFCQMKLTQGRQFVWEISALKCLLINNIFCLTEIFVAAKTAVLEFFRSVFDFSRILGEKKKLMVVVRPSDWEKTKADIFLFGKKICPSGFGWQNQSVNTSGSYDDCCRVCGAPLSTRTGAIRTPVLVYWISSDH